jgi:hypothetical protein
MCICIATDLGFLVLSVFSNASTILYVELLANWFLSRSEQLAKLPPIFMYIFVLKYETRCKSVVSVYLYLAM